MWFLNRKNIGLALGSGGAKGLAHIGVLKVLEEKGYKIKYIAGTSVGALIGGLYAFYKDARKVESIILEQDLKSVIRALSDIDISDNFYNKI
jgi:NTE family protein